MSTTFHQVLTPSPTTTKQLIHTTNHTSNHATTCYATTSHTTSHKTASHSTTSHKITNHSTTSPLAMASKAWHPPYHIYPMSDCLLPPLAPFTWATLNFPKFFHSSLCSPLSTAQDPFAFFMPHRCPGWFLPILQVSVKLHFQNFIWKSPLAFSALQLHSTTSSLLDFLKIPPDLKSLIRSFIGLISLIECTFYLTLDLYSHWTVST